MWVIGVCLELWPKLFAPFGQNTQNGWASDLEVIASDFLWSELRSVFWYFSAYSEVCIAFHLFCILFPLFCLVAILSFDDVLTNAHPIFLIETLEKSPNVELEVLVVGEIWGFWRWLGDSVNYFEGFVDNLHDDVVVVLLFTVAEDDSIAVEKVVGEQVKVIGKVQFFLQSFVDVCVEGEGIFLLQVLKYVIAELVINEFHLLLGKRVLFSIAQEVREDGLWTEHFGLLKAHLFREVEVEGAGESPHCHLSEPSFQGCLVRLNLSNGGHCNNHVPVSVLIVHLGLAVGLAVMHDTCACFLLLHWDLEECLEHRHEVVHVLMGSFEGVVDVVLGFSWLGSRSLLDFRVVSVFAQAEHVQFHLNLKFSYY